MKFFSGVTGFLAPYITSNRLRVWSGSLLRMIPTASSFSLLRQAVTDKLYQSLCTESLVDIGNERQVLLG